MSAKIDHISLLLIEDLNNVQSRIQRATLGLELEAVTRPNLEVLNISLKDLYLKQWYPKDPGLYAASLPTTLIPFLSSENQKGNSFQTDPLLEIDGVVEFNYEGHIVNHDNCFLTTLSRDYWKGDFNR